MNELLIPRKDYLSAGAHIGLTVKSADMKKFIFKVRPDGLAVLDIEVLDNRIKSAAKMLASIKDVLVVSKKENAFKAVKSFAEAIDGRAVTGRFMPGSLTNPSFADFFEPDVVVVTDPAVDKQVIKEAVKTRIPIISLVDTSNSLNYVDLAIPCNNKGKESIGLVYYLLAKEICKIKGKEFNMKKEDFIPKEDRTEQREERPERRERRSFRR